MLLLAEKMITQSSHDENNTATLIRGLKHLKKNREEEALKQVLDELQDKKKIQEDEVWDVLGPCDKTDGYLG